MSRLTCLRSMPLLCLAVFLASGCASDPSRGYSMDRPFDSEYRSIAVPIIENDTYFREVGFNLTDALVKEIQSRTPYKVTGEGGADTVLKGRITDVNLRQLSKSRNSGLAEEMMYTVTINWEWTDLATGKPIAARQNFSASAVFRPSRPSSEPIELGRFEVVQQLASDMVDAMRSDW